VSRIRNPGAYFAKVNAAAAPIVQTARDKAHAEAEQARTIRIRDIRNQLVADGMGWIEANDTAIEQVLIAEDHTSADDAADAQQEQTR
jgi:hypothetical protein